MNNELITCMLRELEEINTFCTKEFKDSILSLIDTDVKKFISVFKSDFQLNNIDEYNRFEKLSLTPIQKRKIDNNILYRYEYRRSNKNIKCIFILDCEDNCKILLLAFSEDGDKKKGNDSYKFNIERAIKIYRNLKGE